MHRCPKCGSPRVHRSRSRGLKEKLRKLVTHKRPHRCHACGWRGWEHEADRPDAAGLVEEARRRPRAPDLQAIDKALKGDKARRSKSEVESSRR